MREDQYNNCLIADRTSIGDWEKFYLFSNDDGTISLQAKSNGKFVSADESGYSVVFANRSEINEWEKFYAVVLDE